MPLYRGSSEVDRGEGSTVATTAEIERAIIEVENLKQDVKEFYDAIFLKPTVTVSGQAPTGIPQDGEEWIIV